MARDQAGNGDVVSSARILQTDIPHHVHSALGDMIDLDFPEWSWLYIILCIFVKIRTEQWDW